MADNIAANVDLIIMGASVRAAAFSALRAGFRPYCLDLFGDTDTRAHSLVHHVSDYPDGLIALLDSFPSLPICYTGGLENHPAILELAAKRHQLWGNDLESTKRARDPEVISDAVRLARLEVPETRDESNPPPADGSWLLRPRAGSGGNGISLWTEEQMDSPIRQEPHLFQKKIEGVPHSAVFVAPQEIGDVRFVGITRQLVGEPEFNAKPFQWCGNIGPVTLPVQTENHVRRFGNVLKWKVGLRGLYGVDLIIDAEGIPWVIEVNPRYPASVELLEHATGRAFFKDHCRCFTDAELPLSNWNQAHPGEFMGKAIYYAPRDFTLTAPLAEASEVSFLEFPDMTDLPASGTQIRCGEPVCTVFTESYSADETYLLLKKRVSQLATQLGHE